MAGGTHIETGDLRTPPNCLQVFRQKIADAYRLPETECVPPLIEEARMSAERASAVARLARELVEKLRGERGHAFGIDALMKEFSLSSQEGVALMCLAESLLRIPDRDNRDRLIRDKLSRADWASHAGASPSLFVNAAAWGLLITGRLVATSSERGLGGALGRALARGGEPIVRASLDLAMRLLGQKFVTGQTIEEALRRARPFEERGFTYSFDMLGEAAMTAVDAERYTRAYEHAIEAIGGSSTAKSVYEAAGISVKLSALHPRYGDFQLERVQRELYPRLADLARRAARHGIGFNIDAEEADRLEPSLDLIAALASEPDLRGWQGLGFVVQAYQKRAPFVVDFLIALARATERRLMVRLVKGAYWDGEIKRAQVDGLGYPVYTRKSYTDVCYLSCAARLLAAREDVFAQFATHNAQTLSAIYHMAGPAFRLGDYEFQCLHGMGERLYGHVVGAANLGRPCRIYAPVGNHETLLAYLVRRLLENGANSSFVHRLVDESVSVADLVADPAAEAERYGGAPHPMIPEAADLFGSERRNSCGVDLSNRPERSRFLNAIAASRETRGIEAHPLVHGGGARSRERRPVISPANGADRVGWTEDAVRDDIAEAVAAAASSANAWTATSPSERLRVLERAGALIERDREALCAILVREGGKTLASASAEVREAVDYCRYYASQLRQGSERAQAVGPAACISPWNFPLAIFTGQAAAALAAGNPVLAKPAEQTPLVAFAAVRLLHEAGVPTDGLQLLPGDGTVGAQLVADPRVGAVLFTGSTAVAKSIQRKLASRGGIPFIAETGGQNAMIVDSTALPEQAVADALVSAFDSAGQRCSALRVLCLQEEIADRILVMLEGAMAELRVGDPSSISTDVGPIIDGEAKAALEAYLADNGRKLRYRTPSSHDCSHGTFVTPALIEIAGMQELKGEVFGPVLHVLRFRRERLGELMRTIADTGYGLTFGVQSRIDETVDFAIERAKAGNIYVNRSMIGAVVGVQPFGGEGLSGTGPKAGGPLYLRRLSKGVPPLQVAGSFQHPEFDAFLQWASGKISGLATEEIKNLLPRLRAYKETSLAHKTMKLPGPVGEEDRLNFLPRGNLFGVADDLAAAFDQAAAALATGNTLTLRAPPRVRAVLADLPGGLRSRLRLALDDDVRGYDGILVAEPKTALEMRRQVAELDGPIVPVIEGPDFDLALLIKERAISINTAAAGGNAHLLSLAK